MSSWIVKSIDPSILENTQKEANREMIYSALDLPMHAEEAESRLLFVANAFELATLDLLNEDDVNLNDLREISSKAFHIFRVLPKPDDEIENAMQLLRMGCMGVLADKSTDSARLLKELDWSLTTINSDDWGIKTRSTILDIWLRLIRKNGWKDLDLVQQRITQLRETQLDFEERYLSDKEPGEIRKDGWELVSLYHLAKAAEILSIYVTQGEFEGRYNIKEKLEAHFDRALSAIKRGTVADLESLTYLLSATALQLVDNSIWSVTRAVNSRVTQFVKTLVSREKSNPIFDVLPPQRYTLRERGLLGSSYTSVVVNLPTSSGKTFIAEFRILQALNQFEMEKGWVAYLAPTRALVNQICSRLRKDFQPLDITVEKVSPALEIDSLEETILLNKDENPFRVLVTTPEKMDLLLRGSWEERIDRPLTLLVVDEAHNLSQEERGIKLELLLTTAKRECRNVQFLLLTPFILNAKDVAKWLSSDNYLDIELRLDWQPNDRAIVLSSPIPVEGKGGFDLEFETLHTTKNTIQIPERLHLNENRPLGLSHSKVKSNISQLAAATGQVLKKRGPVIILARTVPYTWTLANNFKTTVNKKQQPNDDVILVQNYLRGELGNDFPLINLLNYGVGVHNSGLPDEVRRLVEWLFENEKIDILVATTTIAQGVNFPVSGIVFAAHQYPWPLPAKDMPPEDFWNLVGRAGRVDQGTLGIIALAATNEERAQVLRDFVSRNVVSLNSTLIKMVEDTLDEWGSLELHRLYYQPQWSAFLQYLAHTYTQLKDKSRFYMEAEEILRGTFGYNTLRKQNRTAATQLIDSVQEYIGRISDKPLQLVDSTGFSWESIQQAFIRISEEKINDKIWDKDILFGANDAVLKKIMGVLLGVPEIKESLKQAAGTAHLPGSRLAHLSRDWVKGDNLTDIAQRYFPHKDLTKSLEMCCRNIYGKLIHTAPWGIAAMQALTIGGRFEEMDDEQKQRIKNIPSYLYYGVDNEEKIALRMVGVPRKIVNPLSETLSSTDIPDVRRILTNNEDKVWTRSLGKKGDDYYKIWQILEGIET